MAINKYELRLIGHGTPITKTAVDELLVDIILVIKPNKNIIEVDYKDNEVVINLNSSSKVKKNQKMENELAACVQFKHYKNFTRMYKKINGEDVGVAFFLPPVENVRQQTLVTNNPLNNVAKPIWLNRQKQTANMDHNQLPNSNPFLKQQEERNNRIRYTKNHQPLAMQTQDERPSI